MRLDAKWNVSIPNAFESTRFSLATGFTNKLISSYLHIPPYLPISHLNLPISISAFPYLGFPLNLENIQTTMEEQVHIDDLDNTLHVTFSISFSLCIV